MDRECEGTEDESHCAYAGSCGEDHLTLADRCYKYIRGHRTSWRDSNLDCQRQGGYLVSLNTAGEWQAVVSALRMRRTHTNVFVGLLETPSVLPVMYRSSNMWTDKTIFFHHSLVLPKARNKCGRFHLLSYRLSRADACGKAARSTDYLCEFHWPPTDSRTKLRSQYPGTRTHIQLPPPGNASLVVPHVKCPAGHLTHAFLACDEQSACWSTRYGYTQKEAWTVQPKASCLTSTASTPAMFTCSLGAQRVPYSLVCDHRQQCDDNSDESFCVFPPCSGHTPYRCGRSHQCVPLYAFCDGQGDCIEDTDEVWCRFTYSESLPSPAVVSVSPNERNGQQASRTVFTMTPFMSRCPNTHFQCPQNGYCLPVFLMCNGVNDCPGREDEAACGSAPCAGFYRCRAAKVCLHPSHVCDGVYQCPQQDDELFCDLTCPKGCTCHGYDFTCQQPFRAEMYTKLRYLDASDSGVTPASLTENSVLVHLSLSGCRLERFHNVSFPNLRSLDISHNHIVAIETDHLRGMLNLQFLCLSHNPMKFLFSLNADQFPFPALKALDVSRVKIQRLNTRSFSSFPNLELLNLSHCGIDLVTGQGLGSTNKLHTLDIVGCPMNQFPRDLLSGLPDLRTVYADNYKLCCPDSLPVGFNLANCRAPFDEVSSCESLLRSDVYVVFLSVFSGVSLTGNLLCFLMRMLSSKTATSGFVAFVTHLSISDFLMGLYLSIIGVADRLYKGSYLWEDARWRDSATCKVAGFLSLLSNEVSAFIICLITLDRFLVLRFPFSNLHFQARSAHVTSALVWGLATLMATAPLTPATSHWSFYSQTGICIPLPVTRRDFAGRSYAFGVLIILNFALFLLIAAGQAVIYFSVQANSLSTGDSTKKSKDLRIARRLISVAVSDFLCWFPIGLLGLLASRGVPIPGEVNVGMAIMVLPLNSALNPFLYTINVVLERRQRSRDENMVKQFMAKMCQEHNT